MQNCCAPKKSLHPKGLIRTNRKAIYLLGPCVFQLVLIQEIFCICQPVLLNCDSVKVGIRIKVFSFGAYFYLDSRLSKEEI